MRTPVFVVTGLLESGKTTLVKNMFESPDFRNGGPTLLICCEEGSEKYERDFLSGANLTKVTVDKPEKLTPSLLKNYEAFYHPRQVVFEYNGMWKMDDLFNTQMPDGWYVAGVYSTVNCETAELYFFNMRTIFMEPLSASNMIIFNRCTDMVNRGMLRRNIKAFNMGAQVIFERPDGTMVEQTAEDLPYDVNQDVIEINDEDYGIFFVDTMENPQLYDGKSVKFKAQFYVDHTLPKNTFVPGRFVMTCCAEDIQFLGHDCRYDRKRLPYNVKDWIKVKAKVKYEYVAEYGEEVPILYLESISTAKKAEDDIVYLT